MSNWLKRNQGTFWASLVAGIFAFLLIRIAYFGISLFPGGQEIAQSSTVNLFFLVVNVVIFVLLTIIIAFFFYKKGIPTYLKEKFKEVFELFIRKNKDQDLPRQTRYNCFNMYRRYEDSIGLFNEFICYNQGEIAQIYYEAGELHKPIKEEVKKEHPDPKKLKSLCDEMSSHLYGRIGNIFHTNHDYILKHFKGRSEDKPRWCIKGIDSASKNIMDYYRYGCEYSSLPVQPADNTGFDEVVRNGYRFICNDIPTEVIGERYFNPRLRERMVRQKHQNGNNIYDHAEWLECWIDMDVGSERRRPPENSAYKSTLIIPITLLRNKLDQGFRKHFDIPQPDVNVREELSRAIMGLLCFDHTEPSYFIDDIDTPVGYVMADIFSLYLLSSEMYMGYSKSYRKAKEIIANHQ